MNVQSTQHQAAAQEILQTLWDIQQANELKLEEASLELYRKAQTFCHECSFHRATACCETARRLARETRDAMDTATYRYTEGFSLAVLGTIYLHRSKADTAIECFQQAATQFRGCNRLLSEGVAWMAIGEGYSLLSQGKDRNGHLSQRDKERSMSAFQRCLNIIDSLRATDQATVELRERVREKLKHVHVSFTESLGQNSPAANGTNGAAAPNVPDELYPVPIVESIAAGAGIDAHDDKRGTMWLSRDQVRDAQFAVRVEGKSMEGDGILDDDYVIIRGQPVTDRPGAIAAVLIFTEGQTLGTLKHYYRETDHHRLEPSNEAEPTLIVVPIEQHIERIDKYYRRHRENVEVYPGECQIAGIPVAIFREMA